MSESGSGRKTLPRRFTAGAALALSLAGLATAAPTPPTLTHIPLKQGLTLVSVLHFPEGDRENVVTVQRASADAVTYSWHVSARSRSGEREDAEFSRTVRTADLASATRLNTVFRPGDQMDYPGYTAFTISTAVYESLRTSGRAPFMLAALGESSGPLGGVPGFGAFGGTSKFKGTLTRVGPPSERFPLIVNGRRVSVPALHARGTFAYQEQHRDQEIWMLADGEHPLILKTVTGKDVLQMVRIEVPAEAAMPATATVVERALDEECRAELPGIYFAFGTADLDRSSNQTLADVAAMLQRHPQWTLAIEGHTDNIGTDAANQHLSEARARAVQTSLTSAHGVKPARLTAGGFGASRPRESNDTLDGRARNRRVELVRPCPAHPNGDHS
jgi:outer membrane protein OmpA-like peptidoglycan-associated protein